MHTEVKTASPPAAMLYFLYKEVVELWTSSCEVVDFSCPPFLWKSEQCSLPGESLLLWLTGLWAEPLCPNTRVLGKGNQAEHCNQNTHRMFLKSKIRRESWSKDHYDNNLILQNAHYSTSCFTFSPFLCLVLVLSKASLIIQGLFIDF